MALASALGFRINNVSAYFRHITTKLNIGRVRNYAKWGACFIVRKTAKTECYITLSHQEYLRKLEIMSPCLGKISQC
jgi:hypothetical protein